MYNLVDLTQTITDGLPVYPGDEETKLYQTKFVERDKYNNHKLEISVHAGTHIDSPMHFLNTKKYISQLPLDTFIGEGILLDVRGEEEIDIKEKYYSLVKENSIVLLYTGKDKDFGNKKYFKHPALTLRFAEFLVEKKVKIVGMDMISPDEYPFEIHTKLFENNMLIIENLTNLDQLHKFNRFEVMAFPLKIKADSSILRVVARELV